jgi:hypothetical protein
MIFDTMIIQTVIGTLLSVLIAFLVYKVYTLKKANRGLATSFIQATLDKEMVAKKLQQTIDSINNANLEDKDGFIKFLSESREWAFSYIENVQASIEELAKARESADEDKLSLAYEKLLAHLPKDDPNKL